MNKDKTYIILTKSENYYFQDSINIYQLLYSYYVYLNGKSPVFEKMCLNPSIFTLSELIDYINRSTYDYDNKIAKIYELGEQIYGE